MSDFVNYKKRSVSLPPGCQNLIDVLQPQRKATTQQTTSADSQCRTALDESGVIQLGAIGKYVAQCFESRAASAHLTLNLPDGSLDVSLSRAEGAHAFARVALKEDCLRERLMREFWRTEKKYATVPGRTRERSPRRLYF